MSIETNGGLQNYLRNFDSESWSKSSDVGKTFGSQNLSTDIHTDKIEITHETPKSFSQMLNESMSEVNQLQKDANTAIEKLATGKNKDISETMLMVEKADIAFKAMNQIRTKVIEAYKEIMRMQV
jgi:flagellar hook-basal body complex protein FliE